MTALLVFNMIVFGFWALTWTTKDMVNVCCKMVFFGMAIWNLYEFLQTA